MKVNVTIHVDADGLPRRVVTSYKFSGGTVTTETRYTSWGTKVNIKAPHGVAVADQKRLLAPPTDGVVAGWPGSVEASAPVPSDP